MTTRRTIAILRGAGLTPGRALRTAAYLQLRAAYAGRASRLTSARNDGVRS